MASSSKYNLALRVSANTRAAARSITALSQTTRQRLGGSVATAGRLSTIFATAGAMASGMISILTSGFSLAVNLAGKIVSTLARMPFQGLKYLAMGGAAVVGGVFAAHKSLGASAEMERYRTQLDVLKKEHLYNYLSNASAGKPFQTGEAVNAGVLMEMFKISSRKYLTTVMDAAAGFKKPLEEIVRMLGYARSGRSGEAIQSASRIGITRADLDKLGIRFEKSGAVTRETQSKLMVAMIKAMRKRFGGMAAKMGTTTYEGAVSDLKDSTFRAFAEGFEKVLPYATKAVREAGSIVSSIGAKLKEINWKTFGDGMVASVKKAGNVIRNLFDPGKRTKIFEAIKTAMPEIMTNIVNIIMWGARNFVDFLTHGMPAVALALIKGVTSGLGSIDKLFQRNEQYKYLSDRYRGAVKESNTMIAESGVARKRAQSKYDTQVTAAKQRYGENSPEFASAEARFRKQRDEIIKNADKHEKIAHKLQQAALKDFQKSKSEVYKKTQTELEEKSGREFSYTKRPDWKNTEWDKLWNVAGSTPPKDSNANQKPFIDLSRNEKARADRGITSLQKNNEAQLKAVQHELRQLQKNGLTKDQASRILGKGKNEMNTRKTENEMKKSVYDFDKATAAFSSAVEIFSKTLETYERPTLI